MRFGYKIDGDDMFRFLMYHVYHTRACITAIVIPILGCVGAGLSFALGNQARAWLYLIAGLAFSGFFHLNLWIKSKQQAKLNASFAQALSMEFCEDEMIVTQGEESVSVPWSQIVKVKKTKHLILVYTDSVHAYLIPKGNIFPVEAPGEEEDSREVEAAGEEEDSRGEENFRKEATEERTLAQDLQDKVSWEQIYEYLLSHTKR